MERKVSAQRAQLTTVASHLPLFAGDALAFAPGEKFQYSNSGYIVLGAIIEKISGQNYYDYVRENIFRPAGMNSTGFYEPGKGDADVAVGYTKMNPDGRRGEKAQHRPARNSRRPRGRWLFDSR